MLDNVYVTEQTGLQQRLIEAGARLLERDGLGAVGLRAITREVGVSHGAPRRYFPSHRDLLAAIARSGFDDLIASFAPVLADEATSDRKLVELSTRFVDFAALRPSMFDLMFRHDLLDGSAVDGQPLRRTTLPLFAVLIDLVAAAAPAYDDATERTLTLWTNVHGIAVLVANRSIDLVTGTADLPALIERAVYAHLAPATSAYRASGGESSTVSQVNSQERTPR